MKTPKPRQSEERMLWLLVISAGLALFLARPVQAQGDTPPALFSGLSIDLGGDGRLNSSGFAVEEIRLRTTLTIADYVHIVTVAESRVDEGISWNDRENEITQFYVGFRKTFSILPYGLSIDARVGRNEWYPNFSDPRLIIENIDLFLNPSSFYGVSLRADALLNSKGTLLAHLGSHSGDLISQDVKPVINDAYLRYTPQLMTDVGVKVQVGESQATRHFVNEAYIDYTPRFFEIFFDVRIGKLAGVDNTPYGIHFGAERVFKFVRLGGYYERRLNQAEGERILGFYWSIVSSNKVARLYNVYHLVFDTNTNTVRFFLPFIALDFRF